MTRFGDADDLVRARSMIRDVVQVSSSLGPSPGVGNWRGAACRRYGQAAAALEFLRIRIVDDLGDLPARLSGLGAALDDLNGLRESWERSIDQAVIDLALARNGDDPLAVLTAEEHLADVRWAALVAVERQHQELVALDRQTASAIDEALIGLSAGTVSARLAGHADPALPGDALGAEVAEMAVRARRAMEQQALGPLTARIRRLEAVLEYFRRLGMSGVRLPLLGRLRRHRERLLMWSRSERQFLSYDANRGSRVVEVFGDLASAEHVAVLVPGITNSEYNYDAHLGAAARALQRDDPEAAVVAWLGYDTPGAGPTGTGVLTFDAIGNDLAVEGAEELARFVDWLSKRRWDAHLSVIAHSYGSVVAAIAASGKGLAIDDLVLVGSPGVPVEHADDLNLDAAANVWAGLAPWDPIDELARLAGRSGNLIHGTDPAGETFGAIELDFDGVAGHSGYFDPAGIAVLVGVITGRHERGAGDPTRRRSGAW
jgi:hypothetical protein